MCSVYYIAAFVVSYLLFPIVLKAARKYNLVDSPDVRKLQSEPVPSLGGIVVAAGVFIPLLSALFLNRYCGTADCGFGGITTSEQLVLAAMLLIGVADDAKDLSATVRFVVEMILVFVLLAVNYAEQISGCHSLHPSVTIIIFVILTVAGVGIINAVNMIDGIDGLSSGFGITANCIFACVFLETGDTGHAFLSFLCAAALVPFYLHNVFGRTSKMYIGDGGSLFIGTILVINTFALLFGVRHESLFPLDTLQTDAVIMRITLCLAILCIPVFDTLRVMFDRIFRGIHPFRADKRHLHHRFIETGFSHFGASACIITANLLIVGIRYICYLLDVPACVQLLIVIASGLLSTCGFYYGSQRSERRRDGFYRMLCRAGESTHLEQTAVWQRMQRFLDPK